MPVEEGLHLLSLSAPGGESGQVEGPVGTPWIQIYLALQGEALLSYHGGAYTMPVKEGSSLLLYNPSQDLPVNMTIQPEAKIAALFITVERLHRLFVQGSEEIAFLKPENAEQKFYGQHSLSPALQVCLSQIFRTELSGPARTLFLRAKTLESLALFFQREEDADLEQCPFLKDEKNVERIRQARQYIMEHASQPPTLAALAREVGLNEYRLKEGFKNIYGKTVFQFLQDYRLEWARQMLDEGQTKVNDAAYLIGYSNPSHFIAAFRKKFGLTPKKYLMNH